MRGVTFCLSIWIALASLSGCTRPINRAAERRIRDALPAILGPAKRYDAHIENSPERTIQGKLATVSIDGEDVRFKNGLLLDHLHLELKGVEVDTGSKRLRKIRETRFILTIGEANLNEYLVDEILDGETLRNIRLKLHDDLVTITGQRVVLGVGIPFEMSGPLRIAAPTIVELDMRRLKVVGIPFTGKVFAFLKRRFENAADLSDFGMPMVLSEVKTIQGKLILSGAAIPRPLLDDHSPLW